MAPTNARMYTKINLYIDILWFTIQSTTQQFLSYCELQTDTDAYTMQPISTLYHNKLCLHIFKTMSYMPAITLLHWV
jgi:hypothetical protein